MIAPPVLAGAVQDTVACALPAVAVTAVGAPGTVIACGVTGTEGKDSGPLPRALVACTVNVYVVPSVNPVTVVLVMDAATVDVMPTGAPFTNAVTV